MIRGSGRAASRLGFMTCHDSGRKESKGNAICALADLSEWPEEEKGCVRQAVVRSKVISRQLSKLQQQMLMMPSRMKR